jgi:hypothetical protein
MLITVRRGTRGGLAVLASAALVTACAGNDGSETAAASSSAAGSSTAEETSAPDLASGLLPADAFGPEATVVAITLEQLRQGAGIAAGRAGNLQITPAECGAAVEKTQPKFEDFDDVAAQSATRGSAAAVEVLVRGGPTKDAVSQLREAAGRCPQAQITAPEFGQATITFESLPVGDLGDGAALLRYTTAVSLPDGTQATIPALIGAVQDGDRLLILMNLETGALAAGGGGAPGAPGAPPDAAAFTDLLGQAYEAQAAALD